MIASHCCVSSQRSDHYHHHHVCSDCVQTRCPFTASNAPEMHTAVRNAKGLRVSFTFPKVTPKVQKIRTEPFKHVHLLTILQPTTTLHPIPHALAYNANANAA